MRFLRRLLKPFTGGVVALFFLSQAANLASLYVVTLLKPLFEEGLNPGNSEAVTELALKMVLWFTLWGLLEFGSKYAGVWLGGSLTQNLRLALFGKVLSTPPHWLQIKGRQGDTLARLQGDVDRVSAFFSTELRTLVAHPTKILIALGYLFYTAPRLTWILLIAIPFIAFAVRAGTSRIKRHFSGVRIHMSHLLEIARETMGALDLLHLFGAQDEVVQRYSEETKGLLRRQLGTARAQVFLIPLVQLVTGVGFGFLLVMATQEMERNTDFTMGALIAYFSVLVTGVLQSLKRLGPIVGSLATARVAGERLEQVLKAPQVQDGGTQILLPSDCKGRVSFQGVTFHYTKGGGGVSDINFIAPSGTKTALVGASGAGKTTLFALLSRLREPSSGVIAIDNIPISSLTLASLRSLIAVVPQEAILFSATVAENIALGHPQAPITSIVDAARRAFAHEFISELPEGYETVLGTGGSTLSGGQRQRIALARAFLQDSPVLLLDEATSHLDPSAKEKVERAIQALQKNRTVFLISHDPQGIKNVDQVLFLQDGTLVEKGTPEDLTKEGGAYARFKISPPS